MQLPLPPQELDLFLETMKTPLPVTFRLAMPPVPQHDGKQMADAFEKRLRDALAAGAQDAENTCDVAGKGEGRKRESETGAVEYEQGKTDGENREGRDYDQTRLKRIEWYPMQAAWQVW